ncbi:MAG: hypothetical protein IAI50_02485 [Candidatus Eremiobacteraeota bacterium]|nr:hypothetical protein [Candidatus Eremiobacteraeota bacterium]
MEQRNFETPATLATWFKDLLRGPVRPFGDYYELLAGRVESSAPVREPCCS